ncbi:UDP-N-acetylmuramoyl-tripeptide--D-alanyl-D-alanine ligase [Lederbergia citrea]|uniref:UDP-N-acetylmuramoyl-tripeptide--D-alanyl-D-alanine ligase n=1 Tax=Lederbergia citrea TaxID=2833581 RepID=A0A942UR08_9BACI|nr:UDP-N-acetylmuramoyl-tripeptide--D-alanyl-D-alanine ligase [Lederbergia citrea]MBS4179325.1 UDP-N-acetylmuramoyl-tripeptide--D-alanyl-D-alanine ligase [Lederbergia citrea]MBS4205994.1 UDP-N-acetylmuramoyl-tripeptide--D-alanyl-D-alanine ligase [Lederbergia citrea]MBS4224557.1 UDP-N-acetylmuramoyl-tripeptide--D-alanyl-D-alanine ligase [Lederbergia citrea]
MKPLTVSYIRNIFGGELIQGSDDEVVSHGAYRLKQVKSQNTILFLKEKIVNWDHLKAFFPLVLVTHNVIKHYEQINNLTVIKVQNIDEAYWKFVHHYRSLFQIPVIAVTGTAGKSTTKEMIKHILSGNKTVTATTITNNSRTAHLHYLLSIDDHTEAAVFETAVGAPGDILNAGEYFKPSIGIITNIGAHHLNYCKTLEAYISAKGEMAKILDQSGVLILNSEDENSKKIDLINFQGRIIKVGKDSSCHFKARNIQYDNDGMQFNVKFKKKKYPIFVPGFGEHQVYNALAAIAAVHEIGVTIPEAANRLKTFKKFNKQLQVFEGLNGSTVLDDTWSITTTSLEAALQVLNDVGKTKKRVAILGTITDLGSWGNIIHEQAGEIINRLGVDVLITIGMHAQIMADHAVKCGLNAEVYTFNNNILVYDLLKKIVDKNTIILIKGDMYSEPIIELAAKIRKKE